MTWRATTTLMTMGGAFFVGALLIWLTAVRANRATATSLATVREKAGVIAAEVSRAEEHAAAAERLRVTLESELASLEARGNRNAVSTAAEKAVPPPAPRKMSEITSSDPKLEVLELQRQRLALHGDYGYFIHAARLSPEQIRKWEELWVKRSERWMDLASAGRAQDDAGRQTVAALQQRSTNEYHIAMAELLGADGHRRLLDYERTIPLRNIVVNGLAGVAALEGFPLTDQQGEQLMQALIASGGADVGGKAQDLTGIDWTAVEEQARRILSAEQFALYKNSAPATSFSSRWEAQLQATIRRAREADAVTAEPKPGR